MDFPGGRGLPGRKPKEVLRSPRAVAPAGSALALRGCSSGPVLERASESPGAWLRHGSHGPALESLLQEVGAGPEDLHSLQVPGVPMRWSGDHTLDAPGDPVAMRALPLSSPLSPPGQASAPLLHPFLPRDLLSPPHSGLAAGALSWKAFPDSTSAGEGPPSLTLLPDRPSHGGGACSLVMRPHVAHSPQGLLLRQGLSATYDRFDKRWLNP